MWEKKGAWLMVWLRKGEEAMRLRASWLRESLVRVGGLRQMERLCSLP